MIAIFCAPTGQTYSLDEAIAIRDAFATFTGCLMRESDSADQRDVWVLGVLNDPGYRDGGMLLAVRNGGVMNFHTVLAFNRLWVFVHFLETPELLHRLPWLVRDLGPLVRASWGVASPYAATKRMAEGEGQFRSINGDPAPKPAWLCYWSRGLCAEWGFVPGDDRERLFAKVEWLAAAGVLVQLTRSPLNLDNVGHQRALDALCRAFPELTDRSA